MKRTPNDGTARDEEAAHRNARSQTTSAPREFVAVKRVAVVTQDDGTAHFLKQARKNAALKRKPDDGTARDEDRNAMSQTTSAPRAFVAVKRVAVVTQDDGTAHFLKQARRNAAQRLQAESSRDTVAQTTALVVHATALAAQATALVAQATAPVLWTERFRPRTLREVVGNETAKTNLVKWAKSSPSVCVLSGPVGVGKTSLAHAIFHDTGRRVIDACSETGDFMVLMDDLVCTPPLNPIGVVVDEVDNLAVPARVSLTRLLTRQHEPAVHVILICENAHERELKKLVSCASVHIKMHKPAHAAMCTLARRISAAVDLNLRGAKMNDTVTQVNGDVRQLVTVLCELKAGATVPASRDAWYTNPVEASAAILRTTEVETGFKAALSNRTLVRLMTVKQLPHVAQDIHDLAARMELVSVADMLESHPSYTTLNHALLMHVHATGGTNKAGPIPRIEFPSTELSLPARTRANRDALHRVVMHASGRHTTHTPREVDEAIMAQLHRDPDLRDRIQTQVGKDDLQRVLGMKLVIN